ncbi:retrovirus-related pol polyprotein from transposon TNT 1-94, partial [Tanacetum coccineum]
KESMTGLAVEAAQKALQMAEVEADDVDLILFCSSTPDDLFGGAPEVQKTFCKRNPPAYDIRAACIGFLLGLVSASCHIRGGGFKNVLVIGTDSISRYVDWTDRNSFVLFGDAAGAILVQDALFGFDLHTDGDGRRYISGPIKQNKTNHSIGGSDLGISPTDTTISHPQMNGQEVFRFVTKAVPQSIEASLEMSGHKLSDIDCFRGTRDTETADASKDFKENSLNKLNALKSTTQLLERQSSLVERMLSQHMNNLETQLNAETLHEMDSKSALSVIKVQFDSAIQQCKVQEVQSFVTSSGDETSSVIVSDEEIDKLELESHYGFMAKIQEVLPEESSSTDQPLEQVQNIDENNVFANERRHSEQPESINDTYVLEKDDSNVTPDSSNICNNDNQVDQNAVECVRDRTIELNGNLYEVLKGFYTIPHDQSNPANRLVPDREETVTLENESRSKLNKDLVKPFDYTKLNSLYEIFKPPTQHYEIQFAQANEIRKKMWRKSFVKTKPNIFKNIDFLPVSKSISKSRQAYNVMTNNINHLKEIVNQAWVKHSNDLLHLRNPTAQDMEILVKTCLMPLALKTQNDSFAFVHELKQEMHADLKYVESLEDELDELESDKAEFSNMYDMLLQECVSKDVMCSYLQSSSDLDEITELQCLYLHKVRECDCLAQKLSEQTEFVSKEIYTELLQSFAKLEKHSISLEIALQECQEQLKNDTVCKEKASNVFRKEREQYFEIQDLKAQLQDKNIAISELKKLIEKCKGKSVDTKFDKPSVVRQPNAQRIPKPSVLGKPAPFSDSLERKYFAKKKLVLKTNESEGLSKTVTPQNLPQTATQAVRNTDVIKPGMYRIASSTTQTRAPQLNQTSMNTNPRVSTSTGVTHKTNVSRPQPRSNQMKDKVVPNTSHVKFKKTEVEEHPRISSISNQTKSVTACNDSLNSRTANVNAVCATCGKYVFNVNHDACVSKFLKDVNARTTN